MSIHIARRRVNRGAPKVPESLIAELIRHAMWYYDQHEFSMLPVTDQKLPNLRPRRWKHLINTPFSPKELTDAIDHEKTTGIAVVCGRASGGLVVRDFDDRRSYVRWKDREPDLAQILPTAKTFRGFHVYCRCPNLVKSAQYSDGELRAEGNYAVLPPSLHHEGIRYSWEVPMATTIPMLDDLVEAGLAYPARAVTDPVTYKAQCHGFVASDAEFVIPASVEEAISRSLPTGPGQRNGCLFKLARGVKAIDPDMSPARLRMIVVDWHRQALPYIRTKALAKSIEEFIAAWHNITSAPLNMSRIVEQARKMKTPLQAVQYDPPVQQLVKVCACLQMHWGDQPFFLGASEIMKILEFDGIRPSRMTAWRKMQLLLFDRIVQQIKVGKYNDLPDKRRATTWRYMLPLPQVTQKLTHQALPN